MPLFQFFCKPCGNREDRLCTNAEKAGQFCLLCGGKMVFEFVPTRAKPIVFTGKRDELPMFTGPRQKSQVMAKKGMIEYGSESLDTIRKHEEQTRREIADKEEREAYSTTMEALGELGDSGMYVTVPNHVAKRQEREANDADNTGAGIGTPNVD